MYQCINTTTDPYLISCQTESHIFAFLKSTNFTDRCYENRAINARCNEKGLHNRINVNVTFLTAVNSKVAVVAVLHEEVRVALYAHAFIQAVQFEMAVLRFNRCQK